MFWLLWFVGLPIGIVLVFFAFLYFVHTILRREQEDATFAAKLDRFRDTIARITPSERARQWIMYAIAIVILIYAYNSIYE